MRTLSVAVAENNLNLQQASRRLYNSSWRHYLVAMAPVRLRGKMPIDSLQNSSNTGLTRVLWVNAGLLGAILIALVVHSTSPQLAAILPGGGSPAYGQQMPIGGGGGVFIVPGQFSVNTWGCYLMDIDAQTLCAYQFYPADKQLRLVASRYFRYDRRLHNFNSPTPSPDEVQSIVEREQDAARVKEQNNAPAQPEAAPKPQ